MYGAEGVLSLHAREVRDRRNGTQVGPLEQQLPRERGAVQLE